VGASADSFRLSAGALAKWAGPEVLALGVTTARVQAFLEARRQALEAGTQEPFATWLQRLSAAKSPSLRAWALARRLEAGEARLLPAYQDLLALHLQGPSPANPDTEIQEPPQGMPGTVTFEPSPAQWNAFLDRARASMEAPMPMSTYAFWCYRTQPAQRALVLEEAGKVALRSSFFDLTGDPWSDLRFCLVMDWAMAWANEEDFRDLEQALPEGAPRDECVRIHEQLRTLKGYFVAVGAATINLGTPAAQDLRPSPSSRVVDFSFSQMKIKAQPPAPAYPLEAKRHRRMATVKVQITVGPNGLPLRTQVLPGPWLALLGPVGCRYAMDWTFEPALLNGVPQTARFLLTMPFRLK